MRWPKFPPNQAIQAPKPSFVPCGICGEETGGSYGLVTCGAWDPHTFCRDCFNMYARVAFESVGDFAREISATIFSVTRTSDPGELPCPLFRGGGCTCSSLSRVTIASNLTEETLNLWNQAVGRLAVAVADNERREQVRAKKIRQRQQPVILLRDAVIEILALGGSVACPQCDLRGEKDDACMHIYCPACGCKWCYCCGRERAQCTTCDGGGLFLESHPGWRRHRLHGETRGQGALQEFHRRRMIFFMWRLKKSVSSTLWQALESRYPRLLDNTPTQGRSILWAEIKEDAKAPTLGETRELYLRWWNDASPVIERLQGQLSKVSRTRTGNMVSYPLARTVNAPARAPVDPPAVRGEIDADSMGALVQDILASSENENGVEELLDDILSARGRRMYGLGLQVALNRPNPPGADRNHHDTVPVRPALHQESFSNTNEGDRERHRRQRRPAMATGSSLGNG